MPRPYGEQRQARMAGQERRYEQFRYVPSAAAPEHGEERVHEDAENLLSGRNPIREALKSGRDIEQLLVARGELSGSAREIVQMAKERRVPVKEVDRARLDAITRNHQGMLAFASAYRYSTVEDMLDLARERGEAPFLILLDGDHRSAQSGRDHPHGGVCGRAWRNRAGAPCCGADSRGGEGQRGGGGIPARGARDQPDQHD